MNTLQRLTIEGFKSIRTLNDFEIRPLNVLIGGNGAGKSNFVGFFRLLRELIEQRLQAAIAIEGGADACLYLGPKVTRRLAAKLQFGNNGYEFALAPTADNRLIFESEVTIFHGDFTHEQKLLGSGHAEGKLKDHKDEPAWSALFGAPHYVYQALSSWVVYHFHDTSMTAGARRQREINDNESLRANGENVAAFLHQIRETSPASYQRIRDVVRLAAPFFDDFKLRPVPSIPHLIQLEWMQRDSDYPFRASHLSDGTLRFLCLVTALLQPSPPPTMLFDEPELGLHPYALTLLADLFHQAARTGKQLIISTQSALLLNHFAPEDIVVVERAEAQSTFRRLESADLSQWLEDYTLGDLWQKNVLGGRPRMEDAPEPLEHR